MNNLKDLLRDNSQIHRNANMKEIQFLTAVV